MEMFCFRHIFDSMVLKATLKGPKPLNPYTLNPARIAADEL